MTTIKYQISMPTTPGAVPVVAMRFRDLSSARAYAHDVRAAGRTDLTRQDVRIERADGSLVEYAGPAV